MKRQPKVSGGAASKRISERRTRAPTPTRSVTASAPCMTWSAGPGSQARHYRDDGALCAPDTRDAGERRAAARPPRAPAPSRSGQKRRRGTPRAHEETRAKNKPSTPSGLLGFWVWKRRESKPPPEASALRWVRTPAGRSRRPWAPGPRQARPVHVDELSRRRGARVARTVHEARKHQRGVQVRVALQGGVHLAVREDFRAVVGVQLLLRVTPHRLVGERVARAGRQHGDGAGVHHPPHALLVRRLPAGRACPPR
ncbi:hypothetical protein MEBOL_002140 [Melittangium boletus DSM 14713]|uniref:Uncharacterized protein n=1 Tax=Melittangium boletus DSM 14713 TaxID=1294270 RepID=A0A250IC13_9BACT|nr:hypothetical protein MEBOL_002140 [Melittangium boletus DSM 14713]